MATTPETTREPCPDRIIDDLGMGFTVGTIGGSFVQFMKGVYNSPNGGRLLGGAQTVRMNVPRIAGSFAAWGGMFSVFDCTIVHIRQREDPWNSIISGAATGAFLSMREGPRLAARSAVFGAAILALIEGAGIMVNRMISVPLELMGEDPGLPLGFPPLQQDAASTPAEVMMKEDSGGSSSWFGGLFGWKKRESGGGGSETMILESFDTPGLPVPNFDYK